MAEKTALIVTSDHHINCAVALCTPTINLDDGGTHHASRTQREFWDYWRDFWIRTNELTAGYRRVGVFNGDIGELDTKKRSIQLITLNKATILRMVIDTLEPALANLDAAFFMRGTAAHTGKSSWLEEAIANDIDITVRESEGAASWWHYRGLADRVRVDLAHHAPLGSNPTTKYNGANALAWKAIWYYLVEHKQPAPHLIIRSHNHTKADSADNFECRALFTPCWTALTEHGYRIGFENAKPDIGGYVILCDGEDYQVKKINYQLSKGKRLWKLKM